jgi:hypothetical protein
MSTSGKAPIPQPRHTISSTMELSVSVTSSASSSQPCFAVSLSGHPHTFELDESIPVTIILYLKVGVHYNDLESLLTRNLFQNCHQPKQVHVFGDKGFILTLSDFRMDLATAALELGIAGQVLELYCQGNWITIRSDTPIHVCQGSIVAIRVKGVSDLYNWDVDKKFIA